MPTKSVSCRGQRGRENQDLLLGQGSLGRRRDLLQYSSLGMVTNPKLNQRIPILFGQIILVHSLNHLWDSGGLGSIIHQYNHERDKTEEKRTPPSIIVPTTLGNRAGI